MLYDTTNTYEATWYLMNGAILTNVTFARSEYGLQYTLHLENVSERFVRYWKQGRPFGNIRNFAYTRIHLKREIKKYENTLSKG